MNRSPSPLPSPPVGERVSVGRVRGNPVGSWSSIIHSRWVARATCPSRRATSPAEARHETSGVASLRLDKVHVQAWSASCRLEQAGSLFHSSGGNQYETFGLNTYKASGHCDSLTPRGRTVGAPATKRLRRTCAGPALFEEFDKRAGSSDDTLKSTLAAGNCYKCRARFGA
jgi:hypothetical protein